MESCTRCDGTGTYTGYGVCFRCNGRGTVKARVAPVAKPSRTLGTDREEWDRSVAMYGEAEAALMALGPYGCTDAVYEWASEVVDRLGL